MRKRQQFLATMGYQAGIPQVVNLNADGFCRDIEVFFTASVTTVGANAAGNLITDPPQPWAVLMAGTAPLTLEIQPGDEQSSVKVLDCVTLWLDTMRLAKRIPTLTQGFTDVAGAGQLIKGSLIIPFSAMMSAYTKISELDLRSRTTARLKWTPPSLTALYQALTPNGTNAVTVQSMTVEFYQIDAVDVGYAMAYQSAYGFDVMPLVTSGFNRFDLAIKPGERLRALALEFVNAANPTYPTQSNTISDQGYLKVGPNTDHQWYTDGMQNHNRNVYQIREADYPTGALIIDLDEDGHFQALPTPASAAERIYLYVNCPSSPAAGSYVRIKKELVVSNATAPAA